jgi:hypothetical protein
MLAFGVSESGTDGTWQGYCHDNGDLRLAIPETAAMANTVENHLILKAISQ